MDDNKMIKDALDRIRPGQDQKDVMWERIEACADEYETALREPRAQVYPAKKGNKKAKAAISPIARLVAVAAAFVLVIGGATIFSLKTEEIPALTGYVYAAESRVTNMTADEVLFLTGDPAANGELDVYAPAIYYLDAERLIFGNGTGLIIYDIAEQKVEGLVDMQAICSGYYNTDSIRTHAMVMDDKLIIYNTESSGETGDNEDAGTGDKPWGYYHVFDLNEIKGDGSLLSCAESGNDKKVIEEYIEQGREYEKSHMLDAWDNMPHLQSDEMDDVIGYGLGMYSEKAYVCKAENGDLTMNVLVNRGTEDPAYELCSQAVEENSEAVFTELELGITDELRASVTERNKLPEYKYVGDDPAEKVICEYLSGEYADEMYGGRGVSIPSPTIYRQEQAGGELLVFGNFWMDKYCKNGNTLISVSGGAMPACFHLVRSGDTYEISKIDVAEDGENYSESIRKMTEGYSGLYEQYFSGQGQDEKIRKEAITNYVVTNGLGIEYYKDYGWDPVALN